MRTSVSRVLAGALALAFSVAALPASTSASQYAVFEKMVQVPSGWTKIPVAVDSTQKIDLRIHLKEQNIDAFEDKLLDISSPDSVNYGKHMSYDQIRLMLQPRDSTVDNVLTWLEAHEMRERADIDIPWIKLQVSVAEAEELLQTEYSYYHNFEQSSTILRTLEYSLPQGLHDDVALVQPTNMFGFTAHKSTIKEFREMPKSLVATGSSALNATACNATITPTCLAELYNFAGYKAKGLGHLGVSGYLNQSAQFADLSEFLAAFKPSAADGTFDVVSINNGTNPQGAGNLNNIVEANLDVQYTVSISYPIKNTFFTTGGSPPFIPDLGTPTNTNEPYLDQLNFLLAQPEVPTVLSTSYGESEQTVPLSYRITVCNLFAKLGARGTSIIFSSGDSGPGGICASNDGTNTSKFQPTFPGACPWITSVGATEFVEPEIAIGFSSGGFSDTFPAPKYQEKALSTYFAENKALWEPFAPFFNKTGRGFPDVSAQGQNFQVNLGGSIFLVGGTSASAPTFSAIISLVNDKRLSEGKSVLGFLNPALYRAAGTKAFNDITGGTSRGCGGSSTGVGSIPWAGWAAVKGWDPSTGLGTPNFEGLVENL